MATVGLTKIELFVPKPFPQLYVAPPVALKVAAVLIQVIVLVLVDIVATGAALSTVTDTVLVPVQPFVAVAVTV